MSEIKQLPPNVVNKIAAGEVIERPASVVKELLENSVDAGATRIDVAVEQGGRELVRVADNGSGIPVEQLPLAVVGHATSKIRSADDLFRVGTLGFRGEALASIAEVSQVTLRSRPQGAESGAELHVHGGRPEPVSPCGCPVGTTVEVRRLFFNTPVRRKFLRTTQTEMGHCSEALTRLALSHERIHFTLRHNDRPVADLAPAESWRERIAALFGDEIAESLIRVHSSDGPVRLSGYVARPEQSRANGRMQYLILNGRHIRDRSLQHALGEAYRGLLMTGRYPIAFLRLEMPPEMVDVNVHPTKLEVRFQEAGRIYSQLLGTLRTRFLTTDLTARVRPAPDPSSVAERHAHDAGRAAQVRNEFVHWAKGGVPSPEADAAEVGREEDDRRQASLDLQYERREGGSLELTRLDRSWQPGGKSAVHAGPSQGTDRKPADSRASDAPAETPGKTVGEAAALQVHNRYLVTENEEGVVVIDQHALHERILYEELRTRVLSESLDAQQLLVPEPVRLTAEEAAAVLQRQDVLARLGIEVQPFGGDTVLVSSYPAMLANLGPAEVLRQLVEHLLSGGGDPEREDLLDGLLHAVACKAAVKAGDRLSAEEIAALLTQRHLIRDAHHCPHGRPTALVFTREELDRRFKRV